jgi:hypothetical protein
MAHITREGGFGVILLARLCEWSSSPGKPCTLTDSCVAAAIPGHVSTAIFATVCDQDSRVIPNRSTDLLNFADRHEHLGLYGGSGNHLAQAVGSGV